MAIELGSTDSSKFYGLDHPDTQSLGKSSPLEAKILDTINRIFSEADQSLRDSKKQKVESKIETLSNLQADVGGRIESATSSKELKKICRDFKKDFGKIVEDKKIVKNSKEHFNQIDSGIKDIDKEINVAKKTVLQTIKKVGFKAFLAGAFKDLMEPIKQKASEKKSSVPEAEGDAKPHVAGGMLPRVKCFANPSVDVSDLTGTNTVRELVQSLAAQMQCPPADVRVIVQGKELFSPGDTSTFDHLIQDAIKAKHPKGMQTLGAILVVKRSPREIELMNRLWEEGKTSFPKAVPEVKKTPTQCIAPDLGVEQKGGQLPSLRVVGGSVLDQSKIGSKNSIGDLLNTVAAQLECAPDEIKLIVAGKAVDLSAKDRSIEDAFPKDAFKEHTIHVLKTVPKSPKQMQDENVVKRKSRVSSKQIEKPVRAPFRAPDLGVEQKGGQLPSLRVVGGSVLDQSKIGSKNSIGDLLNTVAAQLECAPDEIKLIVAGKAVDLSAKDRSIEDAFPKDAFKEHTIHVLKTVPKSPKQMQEENGVKRKSRVASKHIEKPVRAPFRAPDLGVEQKGGPLPWLRVVGRGLLDQSKIGSKNSIGDLLNTVAAQLECAPDDIKLIVAGKEVDLSAKDRSIEDAFPKGALKENSIHVLQKKSTSP